MSSNLHLHTVRHPVFSSCGWSSSVVLCSNPMDVCHTSQNTVNNFIKCDCLSVWRRIPPPAAAISTTVTVYNLRLDQVRAAICHHMILHHVSSDDIAVGTENLLFLFLWQTSLFVSILYIILYIICYNHNHLPCLFAVSIACFYPVWLIMCVLRWSEVLRTRGCSYVLVAVVGSRESGWVFIWHYAVFFSFYSVDYHMDSYGNASWKSTIILYLYYE